MVMAKVYCVYDKVAKEAGGIGLSRNDHAALRDFQNQMKDNPNSKDYVLICLGEWDPEVPEIRVCYDPYDVEEELNIEMEVSE